MHHAGKKIFLYFIVLINLFVAASALAAEQEKSARFISVSDIHFNPFYTCETTKNTCPIIDILQNTPSSKWKTVFLNNDKKDPAYEQDNGYVLFASTLNQLKIQTSISHPKFVLLLGDLLAHDFKQAYEKYTNDYSTEGVRSFINKTMEFITDELNHAMPGVDIYPVVGNNDTYAEHYVSEAIFYQKMAPIWSQLIKHNTLRKAMESDFSKNGYYALTIPMQHPIRLIALNTTLFSTFSVGTAAEAKAQMEWLQQELELTVTHHQNALIALHIAAGIDIYKTIKTNEVIPMWKTTYTREFEQLLKTYSPYIVGVFPGHLHTDWFQSVYSVIVSATPSISPLFGNNPGFKIYDYDTRHLILQDFKTLLYDLDGDKAWSEEYDFNKIYQPNCHDCQLIDGMKLIQQTGDLSDHYKLFYALKRNAQPITTQNKWLPYYWCAIWNISAIDYSNCLTQNH